MSRKANNAPKKTKEKSLSSEKLYVLSDKLGASPGEFGSLGDQRRNIPHPLYRIHPDPAFSTTRNKIRLRALCIRKAHCLIFILIGA
jgi:hypothetical protein